MPKMDDMTLPHRIVIFGRVWRCRIVGHKRQIKAFLFLELILAASGYLADGMPGAAAAVIAPVMLAVFLAALFTLFDPGV